jgi:hypothetical protein
MVPPLTKPPETNPAASNELDPAMADGGKANHIPA